MGSLLESLDARISLKHVHRRVQNVARFLIVGTFIDDALRVACDFSGQVDTMKTVK